MSLVLALLGAARAALRTHADLALENLALRQQLALLRRRSKRPRFSPLARVFWVWLSQRWVRWREALHVVRPETVIRWHRLGCRAFWTWKSRRGRTGRPPVGSELADLVRTMALANPLWGAPRIHGELLKLGFDLSQRTVARLMPRRAKPPSQTWRAFLQNHLADLVSVDFFVVPTATFRVLYVFVVLLHHRRKVVHFNVTDSPTAAWTAQQIVEAFPGDSAPRYLLRDRDSIYGAEFRQRVRGIGIAEVLTAPRSPWQNPLAERVIGTPPRAPRPRDRPERGTPASSSPQLSPLLSRLAYALGARKRRARAARRGATRTRRCRCAASGRRTPPPLHPPRGVVAVVHLLRRQLKRLDLRSLWVSAGLRFMLGSAAIASRAVIHEGLIGGADRTPSGRLLPNP